MGRHHRSSRRARPDDDYMAYDPYQPYQQQPYDAYDPYEQYAPRDPFTRDPYSREAYSRDPYTQQEPRTAPASPPRRHKSKSDRHRRAPSPAIYYSDSPPASSSKKHANRRSQPEDDRRGRSLGAERWDRNPSPDPYVVEPEPQPQPRRKSRSSRHDRGVRKSEPSFYQPDSRFVDPYGQEYYGQEPSSRQYAPEPRETSYRDQYRDPYQDRDQDRSYRSRASARDSPPRAKSQGRGSRPYGDDDGYNDEYMAAAAGAGAGAAAGGRHRRNRSPTRGRQDRAAAQSPSRGRPPPTQRSRGGEPKRRSSMPASTKPRNPWWQNPLLQAGARTALTAGAQAAMKSRGEQGDWLGAKGAKVATAALGAALVDGFIGQKHPDSTRHKVAKQGVDLAAAEAAHGASHHTSHRRH